MFYSKNALIETAIEYCKSHKIDLLASLGHGLQGIVYKTSRRTAIKTHCRQKAYKQKLDAYIRLDTHNAQQVRGVIFPKLYAYDNDKLAIEMTMVSPPFIVDFGGAYLDTAPDHARAPQVVEEWESNKREQFGDDWPEVQAIIAEFESRYRVILVDVHPGNIRLRK